MLTTVEVRGIMRKHGKVTLYTNKTAGDKTRNRRVKCYFSGTTSHPLYKELIAKAGVKNVTLTDGSWFQGPRGMTVRCVLA